MKQLSKLITRSRLILCTCTGLLAVLLVLFFSLLGASSGGVTADEDLTIASALLSYGGFFGFSLFSVVSYSLFCQLRQAALLETVNCIPGGFRKTQGYFALRAVIGTVLYGVLLFLLALILFLHAGWDAPLALTGNIFCASILYGWLPAVLGVLWGFACHYHTRHLIFGLLTFGGAFLASPIATDLYISAASFGKMLGGNPASVFMQSILSFFHNLVPIYDKTINGTYGISAELFRWGTILFWIVLILGFILVQKRKSRAGGILCFLLCIPIAAFVVQSQSMGMTGLYVDRLASQREDNGAGGHYQYEAPPVDAPDFDVSDYTLEFTFSDMLHADAAMELSRPDLPQYVFTLYHGYRVKNVMDAKGTELEFTQENDRLVVYPHAGEPLKHISLHYSGWNNTYYSNWQGAYLPGFSYFYPVPGCHEMYSNPKQDRANFTVTCSGNCFLNLEKSEDVWAGQTEALNLVTGMYQSTEINGVQYIVPWNTSASDILTPIEQELNLYNAAWSSDYTADGISFVIYSPMDNLPYRYRPDDSAVCGDTLFVTYSPYTDPQAENIFPAFITSPAQSSQISYWYDRMASAAADNQDLMSVFQMEFGTLYDGEYRHLASLPEELDYRREIGYYLAHAVEQWGGADVMNAVAEYLEGDMQDDAAFAKELWQEGPG